MRIKGFKILDTDAPLIAQMRHDHQAVLNVITDKVCYADMAKLLCVPVGTVKSRLHRAKVELIGRRAAAEVPAASL